MSGKAAIFLLSMLAYIVAGQAGLMLSIPPGFASAVWPATGVALALALRFALLPSVLGTMLGSFVINLAVATDGFEHTGRTQILVAAFIALAALLQTLVGYWLFKRCIGDFRQLAAPQKLLKFVLVVAIAGYLVSCSISVLTLWLSGTIPARLLPFTWITWWLGDSLGVLFFAPFMLTLIAPSSDMGRQQKTQIMLPTLILFLFTWTLFSASLQRQADANDLRVRNIETDFAQKIIERLQDAEQILTAYSALVHSNPDYSTEQFNRFSEVMLREESALHGVGWTAAVEHAQRQHIETQYQLTGFKGFQFTEIDSDGELIPAKIRPHYFPVLHIYPLPGNQRALGFDLASDPVRNTALKEAQRLAKPVATAPIQLVQDTRQQPATILYKPVFTTDDGTLLGFFSGVLHIEAILGDTLTLMEAAGFSIILSDITEPSRPQDLFRQTAPRLADFKAIQVHTNFGERDYQIELYANTQYSIADKDWTSWMVLTGGFLIAAMAQMFILAITGSHQHIRQEVDNKTRDLQVQTELAQSANRAKTEFLSNMSHELRTPLNAIIGLINLCLKTELSEKQADYLNKANLASNTLLGLINQTLDHAKIEAGRMELTNVPFSLAHTLLKLLAVFEFTAKEKHLWLVTEIGEGVPDRVSGDELRLEQILINLLSNALKFTQQGAITLSVSYDDEQQFVFTIRDTGEGIPREYQEVLFTAFNQGDNSTSRRFGGTGLGLSISKNLAELMGGSLKLISTGPQGSCFAVAVPLQIMNNDSFIPTNLTATDIDGSAPLAGSQQPLSNITILVVEDIAMNQLVAEELLADFGATVILADNGEQALLKLQEHPDIDLILMDIQMPIMDGYQATARIRDMPTFAHLPIIAMTANALDQDVQRCLEAGMNDHLAKPFEPEVLLQKICRFIASTDINTRASNGPTLF